MDDSRTAAFPNSRRVIVADRREFVRGCLACWLNRLNQDFQSIITDDAVKTVSDSDAPAPLAVVLSAPSGSAGCAWLGQQADGLRQGFPFVPIVLIMDDAEEASSQEIALSLGFQAFLPTSTSLEIAFAALRLVIVGGRYFPQLSGTGRCKECSAVTAHAPGQPRPLGKLGLTLRERAVCELLAEGLPNKLIARKLGLALSTVKIHVHHILGKLDVQNRTEVAIRLGGSSLSMNGTQRSASRQVVAREAVRSEALAAVAQT